MLEMFKKNKVMKISAITGIMVILCSIAFAAAPAATTSSDKFDNRISLLRHIMKLSIVVMANQTTISSDDAKSILPVLKSISQTGKGISEEQAKNYVLQLQSTYSPSIAEAVNKVRLPEIDADIKEKLNNPAIRARIQNALTRMAEHNRRLDGREGFRGPGMRAFDKLITFFEDTANN
jgi:hypothetical protein